MSQHEKFEVMCATAVIGESNDAELNELNQHLEICPECRERLSDFAQISAQALPLCGKEDYSRSRSPRQMTARFVIRARAEGIPLTAPTPSRITLWRWQTALAVLLLIVVIGGITKYIQQRPARVSSDKPSFQTAASNRLTSQKTSQARLNSSLRKPHVVTGPSASHTRKIARPWLFDTKTPAIESREILGLTTLQSGNGTNWSRVYFGNLTHGPSANLNAFNPSAEFGRNGTGFSNRLQPVVISPPVHSTGYESRNEFGAAMGGPVLIATKAGMNSIFHGSSFDYFIADGSVPVFFKLTPRSLSLPHISSASLPEDFTDFQQGPFNTEIDWYQRWLSRRLPEVPNRGPFQCCKPVNQNPEAGWHQRWLQRVIPAVPNDGPLQCCKPRDLEIDWQQRWLKRAFEKDPTTIPETPSPAQSDYSLSRQSEEHL